MLLPLFTSERLHRFPVVVAILVATNLGVFLITREQVVDSARQWGFLPPASVAAWVARLTEPASLSTMLTHAFLHAGWHHLVGNLWMLVVFGIALESRIGALRFAAAYLLFAVLAIVGHSIMQTGPVRPAIGASGAISGVLGCYLALRPRSRVLSIFFLGIIFFLTEVPSLFYAGVWLILQIDAVQTQLLTGPECRNIAWWAHIGGFAAGVAVGIGVKLAHGGLAGAQSCRP